MTAGAANAAHVGASLMDPAPRRVRGVVATSLGTSAKRRRGRRAARSSVPGDLHLRVASCASSLQG